MAQQEQTNTSNTTTPGLMTQLLTTKQLLPLSAALACTHLSIVIVSDYCNSKAAKEGIPLVGDVPNMLLALLLLAVFFATLRRRNWSDKTVERLSMGAAALAGIALISLERLSSLGLDSDPFIGNALCFIVLACATWGVFFWLRKVAGTSSLATSVFCFAAILISTALRAGLELFAWGDCFLICAVLQALQLFFVMFVRPSAAPREAFPMAAEGFFPGYRGVNFTGDLLATVGMSLFCISVPLGMGQAYIGLQAEEPSFMVVLAVFPVLAALAVLWIRFTVVRDAHTRIMRFWMVAQLFILAAVVCHVAFPEFNVPGNTLMRSSSLFIWGFTWFITIAFINYGWRSPIYYCIAGWFSFSFSQMVGRDASYLLFGTGANATIILAIMAGFLLVADQLLLSRYYTLLSAADEGGRVPLGSPHLIHGIMGLTTDTEDTPGVSLDQRREAYMERARLMGKQYLLNEREVEIIALYVLGFTHRKISEELFLSSETVHTYIKRIYKKTNLHSRQELIDYINEYLS